MANPHAPRKTARRRSAPHNKTRSIEDIIGSGIARLSSEAPRVVPVAYTTLRKYYVQGRLLAHGKPLNVDVPHLQEQYRAGFPELEDAS